MYAKYVEVIFARESEKWPIVSRFQDDLERLHQRVGFELFKRGEGRQPQPLDGDTFRQYVFEALEDHCGVDFGETTLKDIANEITNAATDRLCLIAGAGEVQQDYDFVLQSFREYFAATYLANSPVADANKVFSNAGQQGSLLGERPSVLCRPGNSQYSASMVDRYCFLDFTATVRFGRALKYCPSTPSTTKRNS